MPHTSLDLLTLNARISDIDFSSVSIRLVTETGTTFFNLDEGLLTVADQTPYYTSTGIRPSLNFKRLEKLQINNI